MPQVRPIVKIHAAASYFAFVSRDPKQIAAAFNLKNVRTVYRWAETPEWAEWLDVCGYTGDRSFETSASLEIARQAYRNAIAEGVPKHRRAVVAAEAVGITPRKMRDWARRYGWSEVKPRKETKC